MFETKAVCGNSGGKKSLRNMKNCCVYYVSLMNFQKLNCESIPNILLNKAVQLCAIPTGHSFQGTIIMTYIHYNRSLE